MPKSRLWSARQVFRIILAGNACLPVYIEKWQSTLRWRKVCIIPFCSIFSYKVLEWYKIPENVLYSDRCYFGLSWNMNKQNSKTWETYLLRVFYMHDKENNQISLGQDISESPDRLLHFWIWKCHGLWAMKERFGKPVTSGFSTS